MNCGVHAVNNILQERAFRSADFDRIIDEELKPLNRKISYKSWFPFFGDYDASVLMIALRQRGIDLSFHDRRDRISIDSFREIFGDNFCGLMVNLPARFSIGSGHWICVRRFGESYMWLDSQGDPMEMLPMHIESRIAAEGGERAQVLVAVRSSSNP